MFNSLLQTLFLRFTVPNPAFSFELYFSEPGSIYPILLDFQASVKEFFSPDGSGRVYGRTTGGAEI